MAFLPIVGRELREASRRPLTWRVRTGLAMAGVATASLLSLLLLLNGVASSLWGEYLFLGLTVVLALYALFAGPALAASCICEEVREGTLGLLFLTDLKPMDIILGKVSSKAIAAGYGLLGMVPLLGYAILFGGVTGSAFAQTALALFNLLFFSLALTILLSTLMREERAVSSLASLAVFIGVFAPFLILFYRSSTGGLQQPSMDSLSGILMPSLAFPLMHKLPRGVPLNVAPWRYWISMLWIHSLGWTFLLVAARCLRSARREAPSSSGQASWKEVVHWWRFGPTDRRRQHRLKWLQKGAFAWLASREVRKPAMVWALLAAALAGLAYGAIRTDLTNTLHRDVIIPWAAVLGGLLKFWFAGEACRQLAEDRRAGALELLLTTPIENDDFFQGVWHSLRRQFLWPSLVFLALTASVPLLPWQSGSMNWKTVGPIVILYGVDLWALGWCGIWRGISSPIPNRAITETLLLTIGLPWLIWGVVQSSATTLDYLRSIGFFGSNRAVETIPDDVQQVRWFVLCVVCSLTVGFWARHAVRRDFRELAARRISPRQTWWRRLLCGGQAG
ncbi:MAG: ABC transporter permease [Pedosphaera sp.]|nr:ABC transporter permease [Pedosphaera sp.]